MSRRSVILTTQGFKVKRRQVSKLKLQRDLIPLKNISVILFVAHHRTMLNFGEMFHENTLNLGSFNVTEGRRLLYKIGYNCHRGRKSHAPAEDRTGDPSIYSLALHHVAIKAGLYCKAV